LVAPGGTLTVGSLGGDALGGGGGGGDALGGGGGDFFTQKPLL